MAKSTPIIEEDYIQARIMGTQSRNQGGMGLLPGTDAIFSSSTPHNEQTAMRARDRCYISRPRFPRVRSGRSGRSGTSDSIPAYTPDGTHSSENLKMQWEQQIRTNKQLQELGQSMKNQRSRHWWHSSDDGPQTPEPLLRRLSFNPFKRNNRSSDQPVDKDDQTKQPRIRIWRSKQLAPNLNAHAKLERMAIPPVFIPPGVNRIPTPPMLDTEGEVKGKLADFFFDVQAGSIPRRKPNATPGGFWDSDALLISLTSDISLGNDEEEEEGPEGTNREPTHTPLYFDLVGTPPGTIAGETSGGYLGVATMNPGIPSPVLKREEFFRFQHEESGILDHRTLTALARREEEDRRKFEWMVPEHLPTSPLCPLHEKYRGPWTGLCYWHGRRQSGSQAIKKGEYASGRDVNGNLKPYRNVGKAASEQSKPALRKESRGWPVGVYDMQHVETTKKRLASLSM